MGATELERWRWIGCGFSDGRGAFESGLRGAFTDRSRSCLWGLADQFSCWAIGAMICMEGGGEKSMLN